MQDINGSYNSVKAFLKKADLNMYSLIIVFLAKKFLH